MKCLLFILISLLSINFFGQTKESVINSTGVTTEIGDAKVKSDSIKQVLKLNHLDEIFSSKHFTILYCMSGCFNQTATKYEFYKGNDVWIIECGVTQPLRNKNEFKLDHKIKTTADDVLNLKRFLREALTRKNKGGCTTSIGCQISSENHELSFSDRTCQYNDFSDWLASKPKQPREIIK